MNRHQLKDIEEIFHEALRQSPENRGQFLDNACAADPEMRHEIESLLSFEETSSSFIDASAASVAAEMFSGDGSKDLIGRSLGRYRITELLGRGGMGEVYLAEDHSLGRKVALKVLPKAFVTDGGRMNRFLLEAKTISTFNHPNILTIHEIGESEGTHFIATEYIDGVTLRKFAAGAPLNYATAMDIGIQILSALSEAHSAGIIHRDIKPDNIMIRPNGLVKILDFGIAELIERLELRIDGTMNRNGHDPAKSGVILGSANYMSPEQAQGERVDPRSDLFSFGSVMYELVSGRKAFGGNATFETLAAIIENEPDPLSELAPEVPRPLERLINRCLQKDIDQRYQTALEVLEDLRAAKQELEFEAVRGSYFAIDDKVESLSASPGLASRPSSIGLSGQPTQDRQSKSLLQSRVLSRPSLLMFFGTLAITLFGISLYQYVSAEKQISSIAIMPFVNETGDAEFEYLADGMTEYLIRNLSRVPEMAIKARSSVFSYKGKEYSAKQLGRELDVDAVLLGRLVETDQRVQLSLELVDTSTLDVVWSDRYNRNLEDLVSLQSSIARDIAERLRPTLSFDVQSRVVRVGTSSSEAQQLYLKGRFYWNKRNAKSFQKAAEYFQLAIENDPEFALAHSGLADTFALMPLYGNFRPNEYKPKAKESALRALEINPRLAEAHASLGYILNSYDFDWDNAEREYQTALELDPNYATARQWYAEHLAFKGRTEEALEQISKALELDPLSLVINRMKGNVLGFAGRYDEALEQHWRTVEMYPENSLVRINLGEAFAAKGMYKEAVEQFLVGLRMDGKKNYELRRMENAFKLRGWKGFWMEYLAGLITLRNAILDDDKTAYFDNEHMAYAYAATGNGEKALEFLALAYAERDPNLMTIRRSEVYDFLLADPRYLDLIKKLGLN